MQKTQRLIAILGVALGFAGLGTFANTMPAGGGGRTRRRSGTRRNASFSPEVHPDRTVAFRIRAPKASDVTLTGNWMATMETPTGGVTKMTKDDAGVWSFTSPPLEANMHLYFFTVDGVTMADPVNPKIKLRVRTSGSLVEVPGDPAPDWQTQAVPHGSVDWNFQHSAVCNDTHEFMVYLPQGTKRATRVIRCCT